MSEQPRVSERAEAPPQPPTVGRPEPGLKPIRQEERGRTTLLRRANVIDVAAGSVRPATDILVAGGRIGRLGQGIEASGAAVVDLAGRYLMPGLIDLHVHPGMMVGLRMDPNGLSPERVIHDLQVWLRYGVTTVQAMGSDRDFAFDLRRREREGELLGARLFRVGRGCRGAACVRACRVP